MKVSEFMEQIKNVYRKYFPESYCHVTYDKNLYASVGIKCCLAGSKAEESGGYWENDMLRVSFSVDADGHEFPRDLGIDDELPDVLRLEKWQNSYLTVPDNKYMVYGSLPVPYRRTTGNADKMFIAFDAFCKRLKSSLEQSVKDGKIHADYAALVAEKLKG